MLQEKLRIGEIPAILWGAPSERLYIHVHGKMSRKEYAESFAVIAAEKGFQTLSFDLPDHGERAGAGEPCDVWHGIRDLDLVADWAFGRYREVSLFACSLGAYFALNAYPSRAFGNCLFQSPIVDMRWLVERMMEWAGVTPERLEREREIPAPVDTLRWDYYQYILAHPVPAWPFRTSILYAALDDLQPEASVRAFAERNHARLTIAPDSRHPFMDPADAPIVEKWLRENMDSGLE